jgi:hypothetical protein
MVTASFTLPLHINRSWNWFPDVGPLTCLVEFNKVSCACLQGRPRECAKAILAVRVLVMQI